MALIQKNLRLEKFRFGLVSKMDLVQIQSDLAKGGLLIDGRGQTESSNTFGVRTENGIVKV